MKATGQYGHGSRVSSELLCQKFSKMTSVTPRHGPSENVKKRNVRKVSNSAEIILLLVYEYVYFIHACIYFYVSYIYILKKIFRSAPQRLLIFFTFAYINLPYKSLGYAYTSTSCLFTWQFRSPAQEFRKKVTIVWWLSLSRFRSDIRLPRKGFRYKSKYLQESPITGLRTTMRWQPNPLSVFKTCNFKLMI